MFGGTGYRLRRAWTLPPALVAAAMACLLASAPGWAGAASGCARFVVDDPILLPDGTLHPAGTITLCDSLVLTPVTTLHKTYVNGQPVGLLASRRRSSELPGDRAPFLVFQRDPQGRLELLGYVMPASGRSVTYELARKSPSSRFDLGFAALATTPGTLMVLGTRPR